MDFPLYDKLVSQIKTRDKPVPLHQLCSTINSLPRDHLTNIAALIYHYYIIETMSTKHITMEEAIGLLTKKTTKKKPIPYGGKTIGNTGKGIMFTVEKLPVDLQAIIGQYLIVISK